MNEHERKLRAERAREILDAEWFRMAVAESEANALEQIINANDDAVRREWVGRVKGIRSVRGQLESWLNDGKAALHTIDVA